MSPWKVASRAVFWGSMLLILSLPDITQAQEQDDNTPLNYKLYTSVQGAAASETPFWHYANTYGRLQRGPKANWLSGATLEMPYQQLGPVQVASGVELTSRVSDSRNSTHFTQFYGSLQYGGWRLRVGRFRHTIGGSNDALSIGSMMVSRNATPIPKIEFSTPEFFDLPLSNGRLQAHLYWSEGQLGEARHISRARLHQKSLHVRAVGNRFSLTAGITQNLQWAGRGRPNSWEKTGWGCSSEAHGTGFGASTSSAVGATG